MNEGLNSDDDPRAAATVKQIFQSAIERTPAGSLLSHFPSKLGEANEIEENNEVIFHTYLDGIDGGTDEAARFHSSSTASSVYDTVKY